MEQNLTLPVKQKPDEAKGMDDDLKVLVVDDQVSVLTRVAKMLHDLGCSKVVDLAEDGEQAWSKISKGQGSRYDIVITDLYMPRLDGIGLISRCRASDFARNVPFVVITGETNPEVFAALSEMGAQECLVKPFSYDQFKNRISALLRRLRDPAEKSFTEVSDLIAEGDYGNALARIEQLDEIELAKPKWLNLKGEIYLGMGFLSHARECIEQSLKSCECYLSALSNQAKLEEKAGNLAAAASALEKADALSPRMVGRKIDLGDLYFQLDRNEEGKEMLCKAGAMAQDVDTKLQVSEILTENGYEKEADKIINRLLSFKYTGIENYNKIGISLRKQGKFKEAEQSYMAALNYHSDNASIYFNMGVLHLYEAKIERAAECFAKALKINPEFSKARAMLDCFCRGNSGKAMAVARTLAREVDEV